MANTDFHLQFQGEPLKNLFERKTVSFNNKKDHGIYLLVLDKNIFYIVLEFEDEQGFTENNQGATTVTIDDPIKSRKQRKATGTAFEEEDNDDKTEVRGTQSLDNLRSSFLQKEH